jgi:hypothetical protein
MPAVIRLHRFAVAIVALVACARVQAAAPRLPVAAAPREYFAGARGGGGAAPV